MQQAPWASDDAAFFSLGEPVEAGPPTQIVENPREQRTEDHVTGKFG